MFVVASTGYRSKKTMTELRGLMDGTSNNKSMISCR